MALTSILLVFVTQEAIADKDEFSSVLGDVETVSIATGREQPITVAPTIASVFKSDDIKNSGVRNLTDLLSMVPGIHVGRSFVRYDPVYSVRGFSSSFNQNVLIMIDGVSQNDLVFGDMGIALGKIPLDIIERVEVSRGPGSAVWGADAFSMVVNVITKNIKPKESLVALSGGSFNTKDARLLTGTTLSGFDLVAAIEYTKTDGHQPMIEQDQQTIIDGLMGTSASLAPGNANTFREELGAHIKLTGKHSQFGLRTFLLSDKGVGIGYAGALDPFGAVDNKGVEATYQYNNKFTDTLNIGSMLAYSRNIYEQNNIHFFPPGAFFVFPDGVQFNSEFQQDFFKVKFDFDYAGLKNHRLNMGVGGEKAKFKLINESRNYEILDGVVTPTGPVQDTARNSVLGERYISRDLFFTYLQDQWQFHSDWSLTYGVRYDRYSDFGSVVSPRAALIWNTSHVLTTKLLYGRGFRSPTLLETQTENIPAIVSNGELKPEKLDQIQLVFDYNLKKDLRGRANVFYHKTKDQIRQQNAGASNFRAENVGDQTGKGLELELWWDITDKTKLYSNYSYQQNTDETTNSDAGYTPHRKIFTMLQQNLNQGWFLNAKATYIGKRDRIAEDVRPKAETYVLVDFLVRKKLTNYLEATIETRNIFDEEVNEAGFGTSFPGDMPLEGRSYYATLTIYY